VSYFNSLLAFAWDQVPLSRRCDTVVWAEYVSQQGLNSKILACGCDLFTLGDYSCSVLLYWTTARPAVDVSVITQCTFWFLYGTYVCTYMHAYTCICTYIYSFILIHMHVCMHTYIHTCTFIYTYWCIHLHACTHTHIH
jgi:hypothetical protein